MDAPVEIRPTAWRPLTPRGVAAFAYATLGRLLLIQLLVAFLAAAAVAWFVHAAWYPIIGQAIAGLPSQGAIQRGQLEWHGDSSDSLAEGRCLAVAVDLNHSGAAHSPADLEVEFGRTDLRIHSLFGYAQMSYPRDRDVPLNTAETGPWWGAWAPPILAIATVAVIAGLMSMWAVLATLYCLPVWLIGFFGNRDLYLPGSWRLAGAALMPGALFLTAALVTYGLGILDLIHLLVAGGLHFLIGWVYAVVAPLRLPYIRAAGGPNNPFENKDSQEAPDRPAKTDERQPPPVG